VNAKPIDEIINISEEVMNSLIKEVSDELGIPSWWVAAIAIEYTDCREYAAFDDIWSFNFNKLQKEDLISAIHANKVVISHGILMHNVLEDVFRTRGIELLVSNVPVPLPKEACDLIPEGPVSDYHFVFQTNSIERWDPKLSLSEYFQVLDDKQLWQWHFAEFTKVEGRNYGKWISQEIDIELFDMVYDRLAVLRNNRVRPGEPGHEQFRKKVEEFYKWLDSIRKPILDNLYQLHLQKRKTCLNKNKVTSVVPPKLSRFEQFTVRDGEFYTTFYAEPVFYRGLIKHVKEAESIFSSAKNNLELVPKLDLIYEERIIAIILGASCIEAFINTIGYDKYPDIWDGVEKLTPIEKCKLCMKLEDQGNLFDAGKEPYQTISRLYTIRNQLVHYKRECKKIKTQGDRTLSYLEFMLDRDYINKLPEHIKEFFIELCNATNYKIPNWLYTESI
jgi:hypothetical protein